ncbi:Uncharacterized protein Adt_39037 [Abeliophyllum distichum]|uniref:Uncharacterized protein n=1 Tax=Abeliophyllum distichum TaxID=126358 RepID=A0ABD1Q3Y1_9LAMI
MVRQMFWLEDQEIKRRKEGGVSIRCAKSSGSDSSEEGRIETPGCSRKRILTIILPYMTELEADPLKLVRLKPLVEEVSSSLDDDVMEALPDDFDIAERGCLLGVDFVQQVGDLRSSLNNQRRMATDLKSENAKLVKENAKLKRNFKVKQERIEQSKEEIGLDLFEFDEPEATMGNANKEDKDKEDVWTEGSSRDNACVFFVL